MPYQYSTLEDMAAELGRMAHELRAAGRTDLVLRALGVPLLDYSLCSSPATAVSCWASAK